MNRNHDSRYVYQFRNNLGAATAAATVAATITTAIVDVVGTVHDADQLDEQVQRVGAHNNRVHARQQVTQLVDSWWE